MRRWSRLKRWLLAPVLAALALNAFAQFRAGQEYQRLDPPHATAPGAQIEVIEFFYYGCPVCYETEPFLSRWLASAPEAVLLRRVPALSSQAWEPFARLYYTLEILGQAQRLHWPVYDSVHFEDIKLNDEKIMVDWVERNGVERDRFAQTYASQAVAEKVEQARQLLKAYGVRAVPTFIVDGKFLTSARLAGGTSQVVPVLEYLVRLAREERQR